MLELKNITVGYGKKTVLEGLDVAFERGVLTSVIGVNGCGKSTLLRAALGMIPVSSGEILVDGEELSRMKRTDIAKKIAYLAQGKDLPDMTVGQMVLHGRFPYLSYPRRYSARDREIAREALVSVGLEERADEPLCALSGGMRQNAYIAMALAQETDYLLLDEPTTYLDISHQLSLMDSLRALSNGGKGVVAVMHDLPLAFSLSDKMVILDGGRIVASGAPEELYSDGQIRKIFGVSLLRNEQDGSYFYSTV